jgi:hypothetical protein
MHWRRSPRAVVMAVVCATLTITATCAWAEYQGVKSIDLPADKGSASSLAVDGQFVHNIGELQINITNWGLIGSRPGSGAAYDEAPSAMWPAGSGIEHLWAAGLWVGAIKNGVPLVSTGQFTPEFMAVPSDPLDTVWTNRQGDKGGNRYPDPGFDDDGDGLTNEDPRNGIDDDRDGLIDEDFAIIGNQTFRLVMRDNGSLVTELWPEHEPLGLRVIQSSFQWEDDDVDDFVGFRFEILNIGTEALEDMYVGLFADCDIGARGSAATGYDDLPGFWQGWIRAADRTSIPLSIAYMYDADGDNGAAPGFLGITILSAELRRHWISGSTAPPDFTSIQSFHTFAGTQPFESGGDPLNDVERYSLLSSDSIDSTPRLHDEDLANDYRILIAHGPTRVLRAHKALTYEFAMVVGEGLFGLVQNTAEAALTYYGAWFDRDEDRNTGVLGREFKICAEDFGTPASDLSNPIYGLFINVCDSNRSMQRPIQARDLDRAGCVWINTDCFFEMARRGTNDCHRDFFRNPGDNTGCTGVRGKEHRVSWLVGLPPAPPGMRVWQANNRVHVFWNSRSQLIPDLLLQEVDFESYRVWRADGWDRPFGTSIENGPGSPLWSLIAEFDLVNFFEDRREVDSEVVIEHLPLGANTGLEMVSYTPRMYRPDDPEYLANADARAVVREILEDPEFSFLDFESDPSEFMRMTSSTGHTTLAGLRHPRIGDFAGSWDVIDTAFWVETGLEFFEYVDQNVLNGKGYFYAVTTTDFTTRNSRTGSIPTGHGAGSDPQGNFAFATPRFAAQSAEERASEGQDIFVFPNPATRESLSDFSQFNPNGNDPTGVRVMFANLPASRNTIKIFTLAGDLVEEIAHDGTVAECDDDSGFGNCSGSAFWNLVSRNGQEVVSGIYLYSVESADAAFDNVIGRFVIIR